MKKFYSFLILAVAGLLSFSASAQVNLTIKVDDPSKVVVSKGYSEKTPIDLVAGENPITVDYYEQLNFDAVEGYLLDKVMWGEYVLCSRVKKDYTWVYSSDEGKLIDITTIAESEVYTSSITVKVDDPALVNMMFLNSYRSHALSESENTVLFDPENETAVSFVHTDKYNKVLYKVTRNKDEVTAEDGVFSSEIADGDEFVVEANFPDEKYPISFVLPEGFEDVLQEAKIDDVVVENPAAGFEAQAGSMIRIYFNTDDYYVESVKLNGEKQTGISYLQFMATEPSEVAVEAHPYGSFKISVDIDDPEHITFYRGYASQNDVVELVSGVNEVEISENNCMAVVEKDPLYYYTTFTVNGEPRSDHGYGVSLYDLKAGDEVVIRVAEIVRDKNFVYYIDNMEAAAKMYFYFQRSDYSKPEVATGYNVVPFSDADNDFYFSWSGYDDNWGLVTSFNLYCNGDKVAPKFENGSSAYITVEDGDVIKAYTTAEPETYTATFETVGDVADVSVVKDIITEVADWKDGITDFQGTRIDIDGALSVNVDDTPVYANEDGTFSVTLNSDCTVTIDTVTGAALVGADTKSPKNVYNAQGILLIENATPEQINALENGFYIVGGVKKVVRK